MISDNGEWQHGGHKDHSTACYRAAVCLQALSSSRARFSRVRLSLMVATISGMEDSSKMGSQLWSSWAIQDSVRAGRVLRLPASTYLLQQKTASSWQEGFFLCFSRNSSMYLHPWKSSFLSSTPKRPLAQSSHFWPLMEETGLRVLGWMRTSCWMGSLPNFQLVSGAGSAGTATLQSRKMSEKTLCSSRRVLMQRRSSLVSPSQQAGRRFLTAFTCSSSAGPSTGMNSLHTSTSLNLGVNWEVSTRKPRWQSPLKRVLKAFFWWGVARLKRSRKQNSALVLRQCLVKPSCMGYPNALTSLSMCQMSKRWKRKVSFSEGWLRKPLLRQYQRAMSVLTCVETNWESPHMLAIVLVVVSRCSRCSVTLALIGFRNSIWSSLTRIQITAKYMFRLPITFPPETSLAMVWLPTRTWDLWVPRGIAPRSLFWVKGFLRILSEYLTPVKVEMRALNLAFRSGQLRILRGQALMSSTMAFSTLSRKGSHSSMSICGTSSSRMMGHSMGFLERSSSSTFWSSLPSTATTAVFILLDLISPRLYCPRMSPQRLMRQLILVSSSPVPLTSKYFSAMLVTMPSASSTRFSWSMRRTFWLQFIYFPNFLESSFTSLVFMATSWLCSSGFPSRPMLMAMISCSMLVYLASKFSRLISSSESSTLQSSCVYCMTVLRGDSRVRLKTLLSLRLVKGQVTERLGSLQLPITQQTARLILNLLASQAALSLRSHACTLQSPTSPSVTRMMLVNCLATISMATCSGFVPPVPRLDSMLCSISFLEERWHCEFHRQQCVMSLPYSAMMSLTVCQQWMQPPTDPELSTNKANELLSMKILQGARLAAALIIILLLSTIINCSFLQRVKKRRGGYNYGDYKRIRELDHASDSESPWMLYQKTEPQSGCPESCSTSLRTIFAYTSLWLSWRFA